MITNKEQIVRLKLELVRAEECQHKRDAAWALVSEFPRQTLELLLSVIPEMLEELRREELARVSDPGDGAYSHRYDPLDDDYRDLRTRAR